MKVSTSKSATSPSCKPLVPIAKKITFNIDKKDNESLTNNSSLRLFKHIWSS